MGPLRPIKATRYKSLRRNPPLNFSPPPPPPPRRGGRRRPPPPPHDK
ncbi:hypothetical protein DAI22_07g007401 [Oryza sativa Japonica Group]|nr:hypothetical protein DAI22_07g007401 [Oryza sativa Japonica Group]